MGKRCKRIFAPGNREIFEFHRDPFYFISNHFSDSGWSLVFSMVTMSGSGYMFGFVNEKRKKLRSALEDEIYEP